MATVVDTGSMVPSDTNILNEDICFAIIALLDKQVDVSSFMRSSRQLYGLGTRRLLQMGVSIREDSTLVSFCGFMERNLPGCAQYLTELSISIPRPRIDREGDPDDDIGDCELLAGAPLLVPIIPQLTNLQHLRIEFCEEFLECDPRLADAFSSLTTVRRLRVTSFGMRTYDVVNNIQSPLVDIHLNGEYPSIDVFSGVPPTLPDPLDTLKRHKTTLEKVFVCFFDAMESNVRASPGETHIFPHVSELAIMDSRIYHRSVLVDAFPNLRRLELTGWQLEVLLVAETVIDTVHDFNRVETRCWDSLDYVHGDAKALYMLCLSCPIKRLDVLTDLKQDTVEHMHTIVADTQPSRLVIRCGFWRSQWPELNFEVAPRDLCELLFGEPAYHNVTHLGLDLGIAGIYDDPIEYQTAICHLLSQINVRFFTFRLHRHLLEYVDEGDPPTLEDWAIVSKFCGTFLQVWAERITRAAPGLEYMCFLMWDRELYLRITREYDSALRRITNFHILSYEAGRALVQTEGMEWRCGAEVANTFCTPNGSPVAPFADIVPGASFLARTY